MTIDLHKPDAGAGRNPYVGPRSIAYGEPLYGRDRELAQLHDTLVAERVVLLYSPSGAGKSSLLEAGLRPLLEDRRFTVLPTIRVGHEPEAASSNRYVASTLLSLDADRASASGEPIGLGASTLERGVQGIIGDSVPPDNDACLFFDQFEELFTLDPTDYDVKREFLDQLGIVLRDRSIWALFAMREDFIAQLDPFVSLVPTRWSTRFRLDLLDVDAAKEAARRPALDAGATFSVEAANRLVDDLRRVKVQRGDDVALELGPYVEPVQLQVVCHRLWERLRS